MRAAHFDDSAPRRPEDRAQLAAMMPAAAAELDSAGPKTLRSSRYRCAGGVPTAPRRISIVRGPVGRLRIVLGDQVDNEA